MKRDKGIYTYTYYIDINDKIVEITEVTSTDKTTSKFDDMVFLGELKAYYTSSDTPLDLDKSFAP